LWTYSNEDVRKGHDRHNTRLAKTARKGTRDIYMTKAIPEKEAKA
jgi:hypothetical protein